MPVNLSSSIARRLLSWFKTHARDLPWRHTRDPYKIWISEIMLQQTQVDTVIPYYRRWLKHFPTLKKLAHAGLPEVLKLWAGLGYYRRARMLHQGARSIMREMGGQIPKTASGLEKLPGIGRYTAGAVASIAFGEKTPVLDGNVIRVLTRVRAMKGPVDSGKTKEKLWAFARSLVPEKNPGDFNQALMELGATVCKTRGPACRLCPLKNQCRARASGRPEAFPVKKRKIKIEKLRTFALVLKKDEKVLIQRQGPGDRWGGLWTFPFDTRYGSLLKDFCVRPGISGHWLTIRHAFTRYAVELKVYRVDLDQNAVLPVPSKTLRWCYPRELSALPFPSPHEKIVRAVLKLLPALI